MSNKNEGFGLIEIVVAVGVFMIILSGSSMSFVDGFKLNRLSLENTKADLLAREGMEAVRSIKKQGWINLANGSHGLTKTGNLWQLSGSNETFENKYTREIRISEVDANRKKIESIVSWNFSPLRNNSIGYTGYLTHWEKNIAASKGGMLVYGDGGVTGDNIRYRILGADGVWSPAVSTADIDTGTSNRAVRYIKVYASATRDEKVVISRHFNGTNQYIYGQVFNGSSFGNVVLLASWKNSSYLDAHNFDGAYLNNGDFMVVFSDNSNTPKFRVWTGNGWGGASISMQNSGGTPIFITAATRPGTNEIMVVVFDQASDTNSQYFNGTTYTTGSWTLHPEHSSAAPANTKKLVDFEWSGSNNQVGNMVFANTNSDTSLTFKVFTANGTGGGSWGILTNGTNQSGRLGAMRTKGSVTENYFWSCDKDASSQPRIYCYRSNLVATVGSGTTITTNTEAEIQASFDMGMEKQSGNSGIIVYSDNSSTAKYRKYSISSDTYQEAVNLGSTTSGTIATVRVIPCSDNNDMMTIIGNNANDFYTAVWDGNNDNFANSSGYAFLQQGINGSSSVDYWYDFAWDR